MQTIAVLAIVSAVFWCGVAGAPPTDNASEDRRDETKSIRTAAALAAISAFVAGLLW